EEHGTRHSSPHLTILQWRHPQEQKQYRLLYHQSYATPRDLLSFPTRRSSDLVGNSAELSSPGGIGSTISNTVVLNNFSISTSLRSEEHTSELQSPYDLVCRLLLEKKKQSPQQLRNRDRITLSHYVITAAVEAL